MNKVPEDYENLNGWYVYQYIKSYQTKLPPKAKEKEKGVRIYYCDACDRCYEQPVNQNLIYFYTRKDIPFADFKDRVKRCKYCNV